MTEYTVIRQHFGNRQYFEGETRQIDDDRTAQELLKMGLITPKSDAIKPKIDKKASEKPQNKAQKVANKAEPEPENKAL